MTFKKLPLIHWLFFLLHMIFLPSSNAAKILSDFMILIDSTSNPLITQFLDFLTNYILYMISPTAHFNLSQEMALLSKSLFQAFSTTCLFKYARDVFLDISPYSSILYFLLFPSWILYIPRHTMSFTLDLKMPVFLNTGPLSYT